MPCFASGIVHKLRRVVVLSHKDRLTSGENGCQYVNESLASAASLGFHLTFVSNALSLPGHTSTALFTSELNYQPMSPEERKNLHLDSDSDE